jgi:hypothetical protein
MSMERSDPYRKAIKTARRLVGMLQGTMALEGQGLDWGTLAYFRKRTAKEILDPEFRKEGMVDEMAELKQFQAKIAERNKRLASR